jgi:hypothetical protein
MLVFLFIFMAFLNICGYASPLVDSLNSVFHIHMSGFGYFIIAFVVALIFD